MLFARVGHAFCYNCGREIAQQSVQQIADRIMSWPTETRLLVLAPIVRDRKGEYKKELADLRRAGFVRAKIDGKLVELSDEISLNKNQRHTINIVVDRLAIRAGIEKRLSDSLEVAFKHGEDLLKVERLDAAGKHGEEIFFSQRFACVACGISYPEITPRMFSFNSPHGACAECSGIGSIMYFDPELVVPNEELSIADGAIAPWASMSYMQPVLDALAAHYKFSLDQTWKALPAKLRKALLQGSADEEIEFGYERGGHRHAHARPFEGVLAWLDRRYKESDSENIRELLEAYMNLRPCPACEGARLKR
ncbi:MAG: excinuclease ABC subunit UvrA, partial [Vulcanimicrobiaceae bacterium]